MSNGELTPFKQQFQYKFTAKVGEYEHGKPTESPVNCPSAAPAEFPSAEQQYGEDDPGKAGQHRLVHQMLGKHVFQIEETAGQRQGQEEQADTEQGKQQDFSGIKWRDNLF